MATNVELWMLFDNEYQHALSIPVDSCQRFSVHPFTWLRYLGFTIFGNEGRIFSSPDGPEVEYYQSIILPGNYYYVSQGKSFQHPGSSHLPLMLETLLLDPDLMDDRISDASYDTISHGNFKQRVTDRDRTCVMTGTAFVTACHIIPHAKGHQVCSEYFLNHSEVSFQAKYIINLTSHRQEVLDPPLDNIDDTRNGILLASQLHGPFGASEAAFLQVSY